MCRLVAPLRYIAAYNAEDRNMTKPTFAIIGMAIFLIGAVKTWTHMQASQFLTIPNCLGSETIVRLDGPLGIQVHCWGCYAALFGLALIVVPSIWTKRAQKVVKAKNYT